MRKSSCLYKTGVEADCIDGARSAKPEEKLMSVKRRTFLQGAAGAIGSHLIITLPAYLRPTSMGASVLPLFSSLH